MGASGPWSSREHGAGALWAKHAAGGRLRPAGPPLKRAGGGAPVSRFVRGGPVKGMTALVRAVPVSDGALMAAPFDESLTPSRALLPILMLITK
jgi:hypothetical protein